jgi:endonuclease YncB( thermonuclease family)
MTYTLLHGDFVIRYPDLPKSGPEPDGDTITFHPADQDAVRALPWADRAPDFNGRGNIGIRLEAIDALETHFPRGVMWHQEKKGGEQARDALLHQLGFRNVVFDGHRVHDAHRDQLPGYVLANAIDPNGRVIGFIFPGGDELGPSTPLSDLKHGSSVKLGPELVDCSINATLLSDGLVFPAFYGTLSSTLREHLAAQSRAARSAGLGLWPRSTANPTRPAEGVNKKTIQELVIWPKLFRRTVAYFNEGYTTLDDFQEWLQEQGQGRDDDQILILDAGGRPRLTYLHDVVIASGNSLQLTIWPEDFIIEPVLGEL